MCIVCILNLSLIVLPLYSAVYVYSLQVSVYCRMIDFVCIALYVLLYYCIPGSGRNTSCSIPYCRSWCIKISTVSRILLCVVPGLKIDNSSLKYKLCTNVDRVYLAIMLYVMCSLHCRFKADFVGLLLCDLRWISDWQDPTVLLESTLFLEF